MPKSTANYLSVDTIGRITAQFAGGVVMPLQPAINSQPNAGGSVAWTDGPNGAKLAYMVGSKSGTIVQNNMVARDADPAIRLAQILLEARSAEDLGRIRLSARDNAGTDATDPVTLWDSKGQSNFLRVSGTGTGAKYLIDFGYIAPISFGGGAGQYYTATHQLGTVPLGAVAMSGMGATTADGEACFLVGFQNRTSNTVTFKLESPGYSAVTTPPSLWWLAWTVRGG